MAIEKLNQGTPTVGSSIPFYDSNNGRDARCSVTELAALILAGLSSMGFATQYAAPNISGYLTQCTQTQAKGVAACASCHAPNGAGMPAQFPRVAGQHAEYTSAQLTAFRAGQRANDPAQMMRMIAAKMSDQEIKAVSEYIAGLR